jgi:hypothetical protein
MKQLSHKVLLLTASLAFVQMATGATLLIHLVECDNHCHDDSDHCHFCKSFFALGASLHIPSPTAVLSQAPCCGHILSTVTNSRTSFNLSSLTSRGPPPHHSL